MSLFELNDISLLSRRFAFEISINTPLSTLYINVKSSDFELILYSVFKYDANLCSTKFMFNPPKITLAMMPTINRVNNAKTREVIYKNKSLLLTISF